MEKLPATIPITKTLNTKKYKKIFSLKCFRSENLNLLNKNIPSLKARQ